MVADRFPIVRVTERFHRHVKALEGAVLSLEHSKTKDDIDRAFTAISLAREALYEYAEFLESKAPRDINKARTIQLRF
jgi:hypothetical protein